MEELDYYFTEDGLLAFTEHYHLKRGYCCKSGCRHCPWKNFERDIHPQTKMKIANYKINISNGTGKGNTD